MTCGSGNEVVRQAGEIAASARFPDLRLIPTPFADNLPPNAIRPINGLRKNRGLRTRIADQPKEEASSSE